MITRSKNKSIGKNPSTLKRIQHPSINADCRAQKVAYFATYQMHNSSKNTGEKTSVGKLHPEQFYLIERCERFLLYL
jgi:hypothetical protein